MTPTEKYERAKEIINEYRDCKFIGFDEIHPNAKAYFISEGFLEGWEAREEMMEEIKKYIAVIRAKEKP